MLVAGLILLAAGGEGLVTGSVGIAKRLNVPPMVIGAVLVGFGTSAPELVTSIQAALAGAPGVAIGNVTGSNIANVLLVVGLVALIRPIPADGDALWREGLFSILAAVALLACAWWGLIDRAVGAALFTGLLIYIGWTIWSERKGGAAAELHEAEAEVAVPRLERLVYAVPMFLVGLAAVILGARFLVSGAIDLARILGMSELIIGLTIVAVGTSLPELAASLIATLKGRSDVALGGIFGSNVFNVFSILGVTGLIHPVTVEPQVLHFDGWVVLASSAALLVAALTRRKVARWEGGLLLAGYCGYLYALYVISQSTSA